MYYHKYEWGPDAQNLVEMPKKPTNDTTPSDKTHNERYRVQHRDIFVRLKGKEEKGLILQFQHLTFAQVLQFKNYINTTTPVHFKMTRILAVPGQPEVEEEVLYNAQYIMLSESGARGFVNGDNVRLANLTVELIKKEF